MIGSQFFFAKRALKSAENGPNVKEIGNFPISRAAFVTIRAVFSRRILSMLNCCRGRSGG